MAVSKEVEEQFYSKSWKTHKDVFDVYTLTEEEKIALGLIKKPKPLNGLIHIVIPVHYKAQGVMWESRFVTAGALEGWKEQYPNLEVVENAIH